MQRLAPLTFLILSTGFFTGCGKTSPAPSGNIQTADLVQARALMQGAQVTCAKPENCNPSVGMLTQISKDSYFDLYNVGQCTAFLIAPDLMVTNSHCIPYELQKPGADCSGQISVLFPRLGDSEAQRVDCASVVASYHPPAPDYSKAFRELDYGIIRLARAVDRPVIEVSAKGLPDTLKLTTFKVDPMSDTDVVGVMTKTECVVAFQTYGLPVFDNKFKPHGGFLKCDTKHGNSGSPMLDSAGHARAVLNAGQPDARCEAANPGSLCPEVLTEGVNLACVPLPAPLSRPALPAECALGPNTAAGSSINYKALAGEQSWKSFEAQLIKSANGLDLATSVLPNWSLKEISKGSSLATNLQKQAKFWEFNYLTAIPSCVASGTQPFSQEFFAPIWVARFVPDENQKPQLDAPSILETKRARLEYDGTSVTLTIDDPNSASDSMVYYGEPEGTAVLTQKAPACSASATPH